MNEHSYIESTSEEQTTIEQNQIKEKNKMIMIPLPLFLSIITLIIAILHFHFWTNLEGHGYDNIIVFLSDKFVTILSLIVMFSSYNYFKKTEYKALCILSFVIGLIILLALIVLSILVYDGIL